MGRVWDLKLTPAKREVLLAYADHADHEGGSIEIGVPYIAWKTDYSERHVRRITNALIADGLLVVDERRPAKPFICHIDYDAGVMKPAFVSRDARKDSDKMSPLEKVNPDKMSEDGNQTPDKMSESESQTSDMTREEEKRDSDIASAKTVSKTYKDKRIITTTVDIDLSSGVFAVFTEKLRTPKQDDIKAVQKAVETYTEAWVIDAINTARTQRPIGFLHFNYVLTILERWYCEGKPSIEEQNASAKKPTQTNPDRYTTGKYARFIEH